jgi:methionyl-tRNA formyltransferase
MEKGKNDSAVEETKKAEGAPKNNQEEYANKIKEYNEMLSERLPTSVEIRQIRTFLEEHMDTFSSNDDNVKLFISNILKPLNAHLPQMSSYGQLDNYR